MSNWINDDAFNYNFKLNHPNDYSLICQNNILYYSGDTKVISGLFTVNSNASVNLGKYRVTDIDPNQWKMEPYQLFFYIKESATLIDIDKTAYHNNIRNSLLNNNLKESDKLDLDYLVDYYNALKTIENYLTGDLYDTYNTIKKILHNSATKNEYSLTEAEKYIYNKIYDIFQKDNSSQNNTNSNSTSESRGFARTNSKLPTGAHFAEPTSDSSNFNNLAFISVVSLIVLLLAIVIGTMTYIFS